MPRTIRLPVFAIFAGLFPLLLHAGCASLRAPAAPASPTVWSAHLPEAGQVFLVGSVRLDRTGTDLGAAIDWAFSDATELVLELDPSRYGEEEVAAAADRYARVAAGLHDRLDPRTWELLEFYLARRGFSEKPLDGLQPWLVATAIASAEFDALGYAPDRGVDRLLLARADGSKPVASLESLDARFADLSGLPAEVQDLMLRDMLERSDDFASEANGVEEAWRRGDDEALARILFRRIDEPEFSPLYEQLVFERNQRMAEQIAALVDDGKTRLVVVGAAHMLGDRGVPALLGSRGFEVRRLEVQ